jgi:TetR/AcrR family transcriptional regulator, fatty acid metabolism regulator protein
MSNHSQNMAMRDPQKREKILTAAVEVFARKGFYQSKVSEIAQAAEVADGTIYLYFHNKDDILISIFEEAMAKILNEMQEKIGQETDPRKKIELFAKTHMGLVRKNKALSEVIQVETRQSSKFMKEYDNRKFAQYLDIISEIIVEGQEQGLFRQDINPGIIKRAFFGALDELSRLWVLAPQKNYAVAAAAKQISDCFLKGLSIPETN